MSAHLQAHSLRLERERPSQRALRHVRGDEDGLGLRHGELGNISWEKTDLGAEGKDCVLRRRRIFPKKQVCQQDPRD